MSERQPNPTTNIGGSATQPASETVDAAWAALRSDWRLYSDNGADQRAAWDEHRPRIEAAIRAESGGLDDMPPVPVPEPNRECATCGAAVLCDKCYEDDGVAYEERKWEQR